MPWKIVERKVGRAGGVKQRNARQQEWDRKYGDWAVGYVIDGEGSCRTEFPACVWRTNTPSEFRSHLTPKLSFAACIIMSDGSLVRLTT